MVRNQKGFSLVELVITMALLAMVSLAVSGFIATGSRTYVNTNREIQVQKEAQLSVNQMTDIIIDVEKGVQYVDGTCELTEGATSATVVKRELKLYNEKNNKSYLLRFYGGSDMIENEKENCIYLLEGVDVGTGGVIDIQFTGEEYLLAQYVEDFNVDISELADKRMEMRVKYTMDSRSYETKETVKLRNDIAASTNLSEIYEGEPVKIVWIESVNVDGLDTIAIGSTNTYAATLVGETDAVNLGVAWTVSRVDGMPVAAGTGVTVMDAFTCQLTAGAADLGAKLQLNAISVSDNTKVAVQYVEVKDVTPTEAPTQAPTPTPTPSPTPTAAPTPIPEKEAPTAEIYVKEWEYTGNSDYPVKAKVCLVPNANENEAHIVKTTWNINSGWSKSKITDASDYECTVYYGQGFWTNCYVSATVVWSQGTTNELDKLALPLEGSWNYSQKEIVYVDRGGYAEVSSDKKCAWQLDDSNEFSFKDSDKGSTYIESATKVKVAGSATAALDQEYTCELLRYKRRGNWTEGVECCYSMIIPKAQLLLTDYYFECSTEESTSQIEMDICGVNDSDETYKVEILNAQSNDTEIRDFKNNRDNRFKIYIGDGETAAVVYVKVTATYKGTDFTAIVAVEVED